MLRAIIQIIPNKINIGENIDVIIVSLPPGSPAPLKSNSAVPEDENVSQKP